MKDSAADVSEAAGRQDRIAAPAVDVTVEAGAWPGRLALQALAERAIMAAAQATGHPLAGREVSVVFSDDAALRRLNARWRGRDQPTNVLSFPQAGGPLLGDIVLAWETVAGEATVAGRPLMHHIAHLLVHGCLHLLGYDHADDDEAERMEDLERAALSTIGIPDPYARPPMEQ